MTRLSITPHLIYFFSFLFLLCEVQLSHSKLLRKVDYNSNNHLVFQTRMLDNIEVSCDAKCISEVGKSKEEDHIVINLGPSANYTLTFPIPGNGRNFSLKVQPGNETDIRVFMQASKSTELVPFDYDWRKDDDGWMEIFLHGSALDAYGDGKAVLILFNYGDRVETLTVEFNFEGMSEAVAAGIAAGFIVGILFGLPLLVVLIAKAPSIFERLKNMSCTNSISEKLKRLCCCTKEDRWSPAQVAPDAMGVQTRQICEENRMEMDGRQDPDIVEVEKKSELIVPIFHLTTESIKYHFLEAKFEDFESPFAQTVCSVCLDGLTLGQDCRQLYCKHIFHSECIELWLQNQLLRNKACCPNCNADMM